jgi:hypothetical protein
MLRPLDDRLRDAYFEAVEAGNKSAGVAIHVGREVWEKLRDSARAANVPDDVLGGDVGLLFGYPLVLEKGWAPTSIQVKTVKVIR